ncbi:pantoate--beta-alanine ligase [Peptoclostridium litorale DSM 5388]|uniref:Pantothenate synthetase n=1 Tax=Peptoclostridium litorale DSM 5388 TaxID=1121324 RepID=A0A069RGK1_PEPLI|nr:pantoate--beta-alanine ligase [Peptoclostridium litorale]KDR96149.1 pantothenate synthetase PanC [Peptoclostridium litorale DSM 5388]SIO03555.1 pantoate--beta-alanine ligase [Peptoclostridium litorale DSM 5388]
MIIINKPNEMSEKIKSLKLQGKSIGFVPTMGYLHNGHMSLIEKARGENDIVAVSIFVNPTQFGAGEDLDSYPRNIERDEALCKEKGADIIFAPQSVDMYPKGYSTYVDVEGSITRGLCGASRPGHFRGVATVLAKLFNIVQPQRAYFGQKDAQQVAVVRRMAEDLNMDVEIVSCPIVREEDGLAMSSRNTYLSPGERMDALVLSRSLFEAKEMIMSGKRDASNIKSHIKSGISGVKSADIDYVEIVDADSMEDLEVIRGRVLVALAVRVGKTRLIDNIILEVE